MEILNLALRMLKKYWQDLKVLLENPRENPLELLVLLGILLVLVLLLLAFIRFSWFLSKRFFKKTKQ